MADWRRRSSLAVGLLGAAMAVGVLGAGSVRASEPTPVALPSAGSFESDTKEDKRDRSEAGTQRSDAEQNEQPITLSGQVSTDGTAADGDKVYVISGEGKKLRLDAGPPWFYDGGYPLESLVGKTVKVEGSLGPGGPPAHVRERTGKQQSGPEIDVASVTSDGKTTKIREAGSPPPWSGGPCKVGKKHPGHATATCGESARTP